MAKIVRWPFKRLGLLRRLDRFGFHARFRREHFELVYERPAPFLGILPFEIHGVGILCDIKLRYAHVCVAVLEQLNRGGGPVVFAQRQRFDLLPCVGDQLNFLEVAVVVLYTDPAGMVEVRVFLFLPGPFAKVTDGLAGRFCLVDKRVARTCQRLDKRIHHCELSGRVACGEHGLIRLGAGRARREIVFRLRQDLLERANLLRKIVPLRRVG